MPRILADGGDVNGALGVDYSDCTAQDVAVLEDLIEKEVEFAKDVRDVLFVLEAQRSFHFPKRGCFLRRISDHCPF